MSGGSPVSLPFDGGTVVVPPPPPVVVMLTPVVDIVIITGWGLGALGVFIVTADNCSLIGSRSRFSWIKVLMRSGVGTGASTRIAAAAIQSSLLTAVLLAWCHLL